MTGTRNIFILSATGVIRKNHVEYPAVLVLGPKVYVGCNTILWSFWRWSLAFLEFPGVKQNLENSGGFEKHYVFNPLSLFVCFSEIFHCDNDSIRGNTPALSGVGGGIKPLLFSHISNILSTTAKIPSLIAFQIVKIVHIPGKS